MHGVRCFDRTAERRPPLSRPALMLLCLSPRLFTRTDTTTASPRRAASISFLYRAPPTSSSAHRLVAISASLRLIPLRSASLRFAPNREQPSLLVALKTMRARQSRPVLLRRSAPLASPYSRSAFFSIWISAATCHSTRGQPPDRRLSVSLPLLAPPPARQAVARGEFFSLWKVALGRACVACIDGSAVC